MPIGPFVGAATRPIGGWISDKVGGSIVTQVITAVMALAAVAVGYVMMLAYGSATPEQYFLMFLGLFLVLFFASGIGNGSTFRTIGVIFDRTQAGPVLGWTSAVAAYGAFIAPVLIGPVHQGGRTATGVLRLRGVQGALCLVLNWWFYLRGNAYVKNPERTPVSAFTLDSPCPPRSSTTWWNPGRPGLLGAPGRGRRASQPLDPIPALALSFAVWMLGRWWWFICLRLASDTAPTSCSG